MTIANTIRNQAATFTADQIMGIIHDVEGVKAPPAKTANDELKAIQDRFTYLAEGLEGIGVALSCADELGEITVRRLASGVYALGKYAGDLNERLDLATLRIDRESIE